MANTLDVSFEFGTEGHNLAEACVTAGISFGLEPMYERQDEGEGVLIGLGYNGARKEEDFVLIAGRISEHKITDKFNLIANPNIPANEAKKLLLRYAAKVDGQLREWNAYIIGESNGRRAYS